MYLDSRHEALEAAPPPSRLQLPPCPGGSPRVCVGPFRPLLSAFGASWGRAGVRTAHSRAGRGFLPRDVPLLPACPSPGVCTLLAEGWGFGVALFLLTNPVVVNKVGEVESNA